MQVKVGHGGTLDPLATGVLVIGVGKGTKQLQRFLECTKSYEATLLFGAATDTYDRVGKLLETAPYSHISRAMVEDTLGNFRGDIMQKPPIYSSLRIQGKHLYEYAREGRELPREIQERPVRVEELGIAEWLSPGTHSLKWPTKNAALKEKNLAKTVLWFDNNELNEVDGEFVARPKRKRQIADGASDDPSENSTPNSKRHHENLQSRMSEGLKGSPAGNTEVFTSNVPSESHTEDDHHGFEEDSQSPPAVILKMTVTSGFYVRSLCHDLGRAVHSLGLLSALVRTRQGKFELGQNVLAYDDLIKGEEVWAPKVQAMLESWQRSSSTSHDFDSAIVDKTTRSE